MVAELSFGFWTTLLNRKYEGIFWPRLLEETFPHLVASKRTRATLSKRFEKIRRLRNRVFHHEPIWKFEDLETRHSEILETLGWINRELERTVTMIDRFPTIYSSGVSQYRHLLDDLLK